MNTIISWIFWITITWVIFHCIIDFNTKNMKIKNIGLGIFSIIIYMSIFFASINYTNESYICGEQNTFTAFNATTFPFVFIYILGIILIHFFPGWMRSFSNTFGLTIVRMCGYNETVQKYIEKIKENGIKSSNSASINKNTIELIYNDPDTLINEFDYPDNITNWNEFDSTINSSDDSIELKYEFIAYMLMKDTISRYIWAFLLASVSALVTQNMLLSENCSKTVEKDSDFQDYIATQLKD